MIFIWFYVCTSIFYGSIVVVIFTVILVYLIDVRGICLRLKPMVVDFETEKMLFVKLSVVISYVY